jgi:hypothetical protein
MGLLTKTLATVHTQGSNMAKLRVKTAFPDVREHLLQDFGFETMQPQDCRRAA